MFLCLIRRQREEVWKLVLEINHYEKLKQIFVEWIGQFHVIGQERLRSKQLARLIKFNDCNLFLPVDIRRNVMQTEVTILSPS